MKVTVGSYYQDDARGSNREIHITLDELDGESLFGEEWASMSPAEKNTKLSAMADVYLHKYAATRGFRSEEAVAKELQTIIARDLK